MYISSIHLQGFKSFLNKTEIPLKKGLTSIIGPNGCGKSNVVDAIRWVLGEQKSSRIRTNIKEDVIFNGTSRIKPTNFAEVKIVIQNDTKTLPIEFNEVEIRRRLFRTGDNEYFLNNNKCRLKDIQNLFINTGMSSDAYSVIELKMIDEILNHRESSLKNMLDSAAGISDYNDKRKKTLSKIKKITSDLLRINDITKEIKNNLKYLKSQMNKFSKSEILNARLQEKETQLAYFQYKSISKDVELNELELKNYISIRSKMKLKLRNDEKEINKLQKLIDDKRDFIKNEKNKINDLEISVNECSSKIIKFTEKQKFNASQINHSSDQISEIISSIKHSDKKCKSLNDELYKSKKLIGDNIKEFKIFNQKYSSDIKIKENLLKEINIQADSIDKIYTNKTTHENKLSSIESKIKHYKNHLKDLMVFKYDKSCKYCLKNGKMQIADTKLYSKKLYNSKEEYKKTKDRITKIQNTYNNELKILESKKAKLKEHNLKTQKINDKFHNLEISKIQYSKDIEAIEYRINYFNDSKIKLNKKKKDLNSQINIINESNKELEKNILKLSKERQRLIKILSKIKDQNNKSELDYDKNYKKLKQTQSKYTNNQKNNESNSIEVQKYEILISQLKNDIKIILNSISEKYDINISECNYEVSSLNEEKLKENIQKIIVSINNVGPINMNVKHDYIEESERYKFIEKQKNDLDKSKSILIKTIKKLDKEATNNFVKSFDEINTNLKNTFPMFFKGGKAVLKLSDPNEPLESNIIISAKPPGKKVKRLNMLSAGEKALTVISILFAIYQKKPSPFCILDEVDAPLDDINTNNFTDVLKKYSKNTQFILITHNKLTMNSSSLLHGISQEQTGVSKLFSVNIDA